MFCPNSPTNLTIKLVVLAIMANAAGSTVCSERYIEENPLNCVIYAQAASQTAGIVATDLRFWVRPNLFDIRWERREQKITISV